MEKVQKRLWGLVFVLVGAVLALNALGVFPGGIFFPGWWALFLIVPAVISLLTDEHKVASLIVLLIGVCLMLGALEVVDFGIVWKLILPVGLMAIGITVIGDGISKTNAEAKDGKKQDDKYANVKEAKIVRNETKAEKAETKSVRGEEVEWRKTEDGGKAEKGNSSAKADSGDSASSRGGDEAKAHGAAEKVAGDKEAKTEYSAIFSKQEMNLGGEVIENVKAKTIFGELILDLTKAKIKNGAKLEVAAFFGGVKLILPDDVQTKMEATTVFGGASDVDSTAVKSAEKAKTITIRSLSVFGAVQVKR